MNVDRKITSINKSWLLLFYDRVTNLFTLSRESMHNTHQWAISLALGIVTAVFTVGGKENPFPNELGLIIILLSFPLLLRFFIRSCLECAIQYRFMKIRDVLDIYFSENRKKRKLMKPYLIEVINTYYLEFQSPRKLWKVVWDNLRLAYLWIFILWIGLIIWGGISVQKTMSLYIVLLIVLVFVVYEIVSFLCYERLKYQPLSSKLP